jgi:hypothetical protein
MMKNLRCEMCKWWDNRHGDEGKCRRRAPTRDVYVHAYGVHPDPAMHAFPLTFNYDWCGEWEARNEKDM